MVETEFSTNFFMRCDMQKQIKKAVGTLVLLCAFATAAAQDCAAIENPEYVFLTPDTGTVTRNFYNRNIFELEGLKNMQFFVLIMVGIDAEINSLYTRLSASPVMADYEGRLRYALAGAGIPFGIFYDTETVVDSTSNSNKIEQTLAVGSNVAIAIVGATVLYRQEVSREVEMTIKFELE